MLLQFFEDSRFLALICFNNGCEQLLAELCGKDVVDVCLCRRIRLIRFHSGVAFFNTPADEVILNPCDGTFNEFGFRLDGLSQEIRTFGTKRLLNVLDLFFSDSLCARLTLLSDFIIVNVPKPKDLGLLRDR